MRSTWCLLALASLCVGLAHSFSWDIVVGANSKLEFHNNGTITHVEDFGVDLIIDHLTYDVVHNRLLLVDRNKTRDTFIYSFNIETKEKLPLVKRKLNERLHETMNSLVYDSVMDIVFWADYNAIYWFSLKPGFINNLYGNVLLEFDNSIPWAIATDSCKGYVYWTNVMDRGTSTIEKARFDGSGREIVLDSNMRAIRNLVIDQQTQRIYWTDDILARPVKVTGFSIQSADLNGENRSTLYTDTVKNHPKALAVSKDFIYWVPSFDLSSQIWQLPKNPLEDTKPQAIAVLGWYSNSIAANYKIEDQILGIQDCEPVRKLLPKNTSDMFGGILRFG